MNGEKGRRRRCVLPAGDTDRRGGGLQQKVSYRNGGATGGLNLGKR